VLALLGWNPGTEQEVFSMEELIKVFAGTCRKIRLPVRPGQSQMVQSSLPCEQEHARADRIIPAGIEGRLPSDQFVSRVVELVKDRSDFVSQFWDQSHFFPAPSTLTWISEEEMEGRYS
jgi:glutamyl-tRNA synthetase